MQTDTFTVDAVGDPDPITVIADCRKVTIRQQGGLGATAYTIYSADDSTGAGNGVNYPGGFDKVFQRLRGQGDFRDGEVIGYIEIASGKATFSMECE